MKILVVGGAGHVGSILRPALEGEHQCVYLDLKPVPGAEDRQFLGSVTDVALAEQATAGVEAVVYLSMGRPADPKNPQQQLDAQFDVNVKGFYNIVHAATKAGVRRFVFASSMSIHGRLVGDVYKDEYSPLSSFYPYVASKWLSEELCRATSMIHPDAIIVALRLYWPRSDEQWRAGDIHDNPKFAQYAQAPNDLRRLFLAALALQKPGAHILNTSNHVPDSSYPNTAATALLGWAPQGN